MQEKIIVVIVSVFFFYYKGKHIRIFYWNRIILVHRNPPAEGYNILSFSITHWKGAPTP